MSANVSFLLIVTEGSHDVNAISRILRLKGFQELQTDDRVPEGLSKLIPRTYPTRKDGRLLRIVPHPTFLQRDGKYVTVSNAGGLEQLGKELSNLLDTLSDEALDGLKVIAIVSDTDNCTVDQRSNDVIAQIERAMEPRPMVNMRSPQDGTLKAIGKEFPLFLHFLPNHRDKGTLETILLEGAKQSYPDLLERAFGYVDSAKANYPQSLTNFNDLKATVGVVANVLRPGKANQVSIGDDEWFTDKSIAQIPSHKQLADFLDLLCAHL